MTAPLLTTVIETFSKGHRLSLPPFQVCSGDYKALYATLAHFLPKVPAPLQEQLYRLAANTFNHVPNFSSLRHACESAGFRPVFQVDAKGDPVQFGYVLPLEDHDADVVAADESMREGLSSLMHISTSRARALDEFSDLKYEDLSTWSVPDFVQGDATGTPAANEEETPRVTTGESSSQWDVTTESGSSFVRAQSRQKSLMYYAGYFENDRPFGVPYFGTPAALRSHRWYQDEPNNADVETLNHVNVCSRALMVQGQQSWRRRWTAREDAVLFELVSWRLGDERTGKTDKEIRPVVRQWTENLWESLAVQAGRKLNGRGGHALKCRYLAGIAVAVSGSGSGSDSDSRADTGENICADDADAVLRDTGSIAACLHDSDGGWDVVGAAVGRGALWCLRRWAKLRTVGCRSGWSADEDKQLRRAVEAVGKQWSAVGLLVGRRTGAQCLHRYTKQLEQPRGGRWIKQEVEVLRDAVGAVGPDWVAVSKYVGSRTDIQCREKWLSGVDPMIRRGPWDKNEDDRLREAVHMVQNSECKPFRWVTVAASVGGRASSQCRRRFNLLLAGEQLGQRKQRERQENDEAKEGNTGVAHETLGKRDRKRSLESGPTSEGEKEVKMYKMGTDDGTKNRKHGRWNMAEEQALADAVRQHGSRDWTTIRRSVTTRSAQQCAAKWVAMTRAATAGGSKDSASSKPTKRKSGRWRVSEERALQVAVSRLGCAWDLVAANVGTRDARQCRLKFCKGSSSGGAAAWSADEDAKIGAGGEARWYAMATGG